MSLRAILEEKKKKNKDRQAFINELKEQYPDYFMFVNMDDRELEIDTAYALVQLEDRIAEMQDQIEELKEML